MTFEEWSELWDALFNRGDYYLVLVHCIKNYNPKWNYGKN